MGGGGAEVMLGAIAEELHKGGHEILLVTLYDHHDTFINFPNKDFIEKHIVVKKCSTRVEISFRKKNKNNKLAFSRISRRI